MKKIKRIGVLTSGGDSPGMNAAIRSVVRAALQYGISVCGIYHGYAGVLRNEIKELTHRSVSNIINRGGTILKTSRCPEMYKISGQKKATEIIKANNIDALVVIGGNGSYRAAAVLDKNWGIPCIGVPATIDNDIKGTDSTIGSDTAVNTALDAIDKIRDTCSSLERIFVIEVMGRHSGFIALQVGLAGGAEEVILPRERINLNKMCEDITEGHIIGKASWIIIVAEGASRSSGYITNYIKRKTSLDVRLTVLGHIQRGGVPTARDRNLATFLGANAVCTLVKKQHFKAIGMLSDKLNVVDLDFATKIYREDRTLAKLIRLLT